MKTPVLLLIGLLIELALHAQNDKYYQTFNGNKVYIVFLGKKDFDSALKKACTEFWKASPIAGFITRDKLNDLIDDKSNSFIVCKEWDYEIRTSMNSTRRTAGLFLINGGKNKISKYELFYHVVASTDIDLYGYEYNIENARYRLPLMVANVSEFVHPGKFNNALPKAIKSKTLLINKNLVEKGNKVKPNILKEALSLYKYKYEIADEDKIMSAINARDSNYALLVPVLHDQASYVQVYDLATYKSVYSYYRKKTVFRFPWVRENAFEDFNNAFR